MSSIDFDDAQQIHSRIYPIPPIPLFHPPPHLAIAAAFEGMHHWEHENRQGSVERIPRDGARSRLLTVVARDTEKLLDTTTMVDPSFVMNSAARCAMQLYDQQYGEREWYDPGQMAAHKTMTGEWKEDAVTRAPSF